MSVEIPVEREVYQRCSTVGDGFCAFHAAFGEWNYRLQQFKCDDHARLRSIIAQKIRTANATSILSPKIGWAIKQLIMENKKRNETDIHIIHAQKNYENYLRASAEAKQNAFAIFEAKLQSYPRIVEYVETFVRNYIEDYPSTHFQPFPAQNKERLGNEFFQRFTTCRNQDEDRLRGLIAQEPELLALYNIFNNGEEIFNWEAVLNDPNIIEEYARFFENDGSWLLPCEIDLVAHALGRTLEFYNADVFEPEIFNPNQPEKYVLRFDGFGHYEKMVKAQPARANHAKPSQAKVEEPEVVAKPFDFGSFQDVSARIDQQHDEQIKQLSTRKTDAEKALKLLNVVVSKKNKNKKIAAQKEKIKAVELGIGAKKDELKNAKSRTSLLQQRFNQLEQQHDEINFEGDLDKKVDWVVKREALQALQAESRSEAAKRKIPLQQATVSGQLKVQQDIENQLTQTIASMKAEYATLEKKQVERNKENKELSQNLALRQKEHKDLTTIQAQKQLMFDQSDLALKNHEAKILQMTQDYQIIGNQLRQDLTNAKNHLQNQQNDKVNTDAGIRQKQLAIQDLDNRRTKTITVDKWVLENKQKWVGHWIGMFTGGWHHYQEWVCYKIPTVVDDSDVLAQIAANQSQIAVFTASLTGITQNIATVNATIAQTQTKLTQHEAVWPGIKEGLDKEKWRLQDEKNKLSGELQDAMGKTLQKENEINHIKESQRRKAEEIAHAQAILDDRKKTLEIFTKDLKICQSHIQRMKQEVEQVKTASAKLPAQKKVQSKDKTDVELQIIQAKLVAKTQLDQAQKEEAEIEKGILALQSLLEKDKYDLFEISHPQDPKIVERKELDEISYKSVVENADRQIANLNETRANLQQKLLLGQGYIVSGYQANNVLLDNFIMCLLQGVFRTYPIFKLDNAVNTISPEAWKIHVNKIKAKLTASNIIINPQDKSIFPEMMAKIVDVVNQEYQSDNVNLVVTISGRRLVTQQASPVKNIVELNVWQRDIDFYLMLPERQVYQDQPPLKDGHKVFSARAHKLLAELLPPNKGMSVLCEAVISRDCQKELKDCAPEVLANYCREELQRDRGSKKSFRELFEFLFDKISSPKTLSHESKDIFLQAVQYCFSQLDAIFPDLTKDQQKEIYDGCLDHYLAELKSCIATEIRRRADEENNTKKLVDENKATMANKMDQIKKDMDAQEAQIAKIEAELAKQEAELLKRKEQAKQLEQHYQQQAGEIKAEVEKLRLVKAGLEKELKTLGNPESSGQAHAEALKKQNMDIKSRLAKFEAQEKEVLAKIDEARKAKLALETEKIEVDNKRKKFEDIRVRNEGYKAVEDQKIKFLEMWRNFLKGVHQELLNNKAAYMNRQDILVKSLEQLNKLNGNALLKCYEYFVKEVDCLKKFNNAEIRDCIAKAYDDEYKLLSSNWSDDLKNVLNDVLSSPEFSSEVISPLVIKGNNIAWSQIVSELKNIFEKRLACYGLGCDAQNKLIVKNIKLVGILNELPEALKKLFQYYITLHCQHYTIVSENRVDQTPHWSEMEKQLSEQALSTILGSSDIDLMDVIRAHVDSIEITAGHHLYLDSDVILPGINVTFFSKDKIHCKDNLVVNTSAKKEKEIQVGSAKGGDDYKPESGREGDDGLDGFAGVCAGHIIFNAETEIENITQIKLIANGANGLKGQIAGTGGKGHKGVDMPNAEATDTDGWSSAQFRVAYGRIPGVDENGNRIAGSNELSGPGGNAGLAGLGGEGGLAGGIIVVDQKNNISSDGNNPGVTLSPITIEQKKGGRSEDAERNTPGGEPGQAGAVGGDHISIKKSFFKKTEVQSGQVSEDVYDHPEDYMRPDEACGFTLSPHGLFGYVIRRGRSANNQKEVIVNKHYAKLDVKSNAIPRRDERSRGERGKHNSEADRKKSEAQRKATQQSQTLQHQQNQISRINQTATSINQTHVVNQCENQYEAEIARYRGRSEQLGKEIQTCKAQEAQCVQRSQQLTTELNTISQTIGELDAKLQQINQLKAQANNQLTANDLAQLENLRKLAERGVERIQAQANLASADIDINSEQGVGVKLQQFHAAIQHALQASQNLLGHNIENLKAARLLQREGLLALQEEYAKMEKAFNEVASKKTSESDLHRLAEDLLHVEQRKEKSLLSEQVSVLADAKVVEDKKDALLKELEEIEQEQREIVLKIPSKDAQSLKILELFRDLFGENGRLKDLVESLKMASQEDLWLIALKNIGGELPSLREKGGITQKNYHLFRHLIKYGENIIKASSFECEALFELIPHLGTLMQVLEKDDKRAKLLLKDLYAVVETKIIEKLSEEICEKIESDKQKKVTKISLQEKLKKALLFRSAVNSVMSAKNQIQSNLDYLSSVKQMIFERKETTYKKPASEIFSQVIENTQSSLPLVPKDNKSKFSQEVEFLLNELKISYKSKNVRPEKIFEGLQLEIECRSICAEASYETRLAPSTPKAIKEIQSKVQQEIEARKKKLKEFIHRLQHATHPYSKVLLERLIQHHQILTLMNARLSFENNPGVRGKRLDEMYTEAMTLILSTEKEINDQLKMVAQKTMLNFIHTVSVTSQEWLEILGQVQNKELLAKNNGFIALAVLKKIIDSNDTAKTIAAFKSCHSVLGESEALRALEFSALSKVFYNLRDNIVEKRKTDVESIKSHLNVLDTLPALWLSSYCEISSYRRHHAIEVLSACDVTQENLVRLTQLQHEHYEAQKKALTKIPEIINKIRRQDEAGLKELEKSLGIFQLLINNTPELITQDELMALEQQYYQLSQCIVSQYADENIDESKTDFVNSLKYHGELFQQLINQRYSTLILKKLEGVAKERDEKRQVLAGVIQEVMNHFERVVKSQKEKRFPSTQTSFIKYLLKKLENYRFDIEFLTTVKNEIFAIDEIEKIEAYLINKVNKESIKVAKKKSLFSKVECPTAELTQSLKVLTAELGRNPSRINKYISAWANFSSHVMDYLNAHKGANPLLKENSWLAQFFMDSNELFINITCGNTSQEELLLDRTAMFQAWLRRVYNPSQPEKFLGLQGLLQALKLSTPKLDYYVYSNRMLASLAVQSEQDKVDKAWFSSSQQLLKNLQNTFALIDVDRGAVETRAAVVRELSNLTAANTVENCEKIFAEKNEYLGTVKRKVCQSTPFSKKGTAEAKTVVDSIVSFDSVFFSDSLALRKLYLNVVQLTVEDLDKVSVFVKDFISYQASADTHRAPEIKWYEDLIARHLSKLYAVKYLNSQKENPAAALLFNHLTELTEQNEKHAIALVMYFKLSENKEYRTELKQAKNYLEYISALIHSGPITSEVMYAEVEGALLIPANKWKIACFMAVLPLLDERTLPEENVNKLLEALLHYSSEMQKSFGTKTNEVNFKKGNLCIDPVTNLQLLQVMMGYCIRHYYLPKREKGSPEHDLMLRAIAYLDSSYAKAFQTQNVAKSPSEYLKGIQKGYALVKSLSSQKLEEVERIEVGDLLNPFEQMLLKKIRSMFTTGEKIDNELKRSNSLQWEKVLREKYFEMVVSVFHEKSTPSDVEDFSDLFIQAYSVLQQSDSQEEQWLDCVNKIRDKFIHKELSLSDVKNILESVVSLRDFSHVKAALDYKLPGALLVRECLYAECVEAIKHSLNNPKEQTAILAKLEQLKLVIFNEDRGHVLLHKLSCALFTYRNVEKSNIYPAYLNELLDLISETQAYRQLHLLKDQSRKSLSNTNVLQWNHHLKREKIIQLFYLEKERTSKDVDTLVQYINQLSKEKLALTNRLVKLLHKNIVFFKTVDLLNGFLKNFVNRYWDLNDADLAELEQKLPPEWFELLNTKAEARLSVQTNQALNGRNPSEIVEEMRKKIDGINKPIAELIEARLMDETTGTKISYIEKTIAEIKSLYESGIKNWTEEQIKAWTVEFKKNGVQNLADQGKVNQLVAVFIAASHLKTKRIPRDAQLAALLINIDAIQKNKGRLGNVFTGEGKTLVVALTTIVLCLKNEKVDIVTANEVLAEQAVKANESLFGVFGIKVSNNCDTDCEKNENLRKERYSECQVIYGTTGSFQRDILLTNFFGKPIRGQQGQAVIGNHLIIDEVDSMFIDNAEKILYISHPIQDLKYLSDLFLMIWASTNSPDNAVGYEKNIEQVEKFVFEQIKEKNIVYPSSIDSFVKSRLKIWIKNAYLAKNMQEGKEYIIPTAGEKTNKVVVMDLDTGVEQVTTQWSNGLHQFIQLKHSQKLSTESLKAVFMSNAVFFQSYQGHIIGMTGTLGSETEMKLMSELYGVDYFELPRNKPERYVQEDPIVELTREKWVKAIIDEVNRKQFVGEANKNKAPEKIKENKSVSQKSLHELQAKHAEAVNVLGGLQEKEKVLVQQLESLTTQLARDVVVSDNKKISRDKIIAQKQKKTKELAKCRSNIEAQQKMLEKIKYGKNGIENTKNEIRNAEFELENSGARPILIICANVKDAKEIESYIKNDLVLKRCKLTTLYSREDKVPDYKLDPNEIVIATNIGGRGTDLELLPIVEKNKGLFVINSYVSPNIRVETQTFGRTSRNGNRGSGRFIVCSDNRNVTLETLREIRDIDEARRLDKIRTQGIPKLLREQNLFTKFIELQRQIKEKIESQYKQPTEFDRKAVEVQLKSLQNKWAFFLDDLDKKIADIDGVPESDLTRAFQVFEADIREKLNQIPFGLISDPAELMRMARYCMDPDIKKDFSSEVGYRLAEEYLDAIIEKEPNFSGFAHYYKANCNFGQRRNDVASKSSARQSLKKAIDLLEEKIARLSTSAQFIKILRGKQKDSGLGLVHDDFSKAISGEISLIQIHINAAREALGTELSAESFKSGTVTGEEIHDVFKKVREQLKEVIKGYRLSKKALIKAVTNNDNVSVDKIFVKGKQIDLPPLSPLAQAEIISRIKSRVGIELEKRASINPELFSDLFVSKQQFLDGLGSSRFVKQTVYKLHEDAVKNAMGKWDAEVFSDIDAVISQKIKEEVLAITLPKNESELIAMFTAHSLSLAKSKAIIEYLKSKSILEMTESYFLNAEVQKIIKAHKSTIVLRDQPALDIASLKLEAFPEFKGNVEALSQALKPSAQLTAEGLALDEKAFNLLFQLLKESGYFKSPLLEKLGLHKVFPHAHTHRDIENEVVRLFEASQRGEYCEVSLPTNTQDRIKKLWDYLKSAKVVKDPGVKFALASDPSNRLDDMKALIKARISEVVKDKSKEDQDKYIDSIYSTLEKAVGKIKQFENLKIDPKILQNFLSTGNVPPELADFINESVDIVLSLAEDKGWSWDAFFCALLGVLQIAAGVIIGALSFGAAAFISAVLISEGISDLVFAVQSAINGNFSWAAYGERKWQSLLISVATAGIAMGVGAATGAAASAASSSISAIAQKFVVQLAEAGLACILAVATDQLVKQVLSLVLDSLDKNFDSWVRGSATFQAAEKRLNTLMGNLYDKFGAAEATTIINEAIAANSRNRAECFENVFTGKLTETLQKLSSTLGIVSEQLKNTGNSAAATIGLIAKIAGHAATGADIVNKFRDIASMTPETLKMLEQSLERAYHKRAPSAADVARANSGKTKEAFCSEILDKQTKEIIKQIKEFLKRAVLTPGTQALLQMAVKPVNEALNQQLMNNLKEAEKKAPVPELPEEKESVGILADHKEKDKDRAPSEPVPKKSNRSPAGVPSEKHHAKTFAEKTQKSQFNLGYDRQDRGLTLRGGEFNWNLADNSTYVQQGPQRFQFWDGVGCAASLLQVGAGATMMASGVGTLPGALAVGMGVDSAIASCSSFVTGRHHNTYLHKGLAEFGDVTGLYGDMGATYGELAINAGMALPSLVKGGATLVNAARTRFGLFSKGAVVEEGFGHVGAAQRYRYEPSPKHHGGRNAGDHISPAPVNGQQALDASLNIKSTSLRRVGIDYETNSFVIFNNTERHIFHGHVQTWESLENEMRSTLMKSGMADKRGNIL